MKKSMDSASLMFDDAEKTPESNKNVPVTVEFDLKINK